MIRKNSLKVEIHTWYAIFKKAKKHIYSMLDEQKKSWFRRHWIISGILGFFALFLVIGIFQGISKNATGNVINDGTQKEVLPASYEEAKQKAVDVSYENLMRYSESYKNKWVCFKGEVIQVVSDIPGLELRVSTKKDEWIGYMEEVVYLYSTDYSGERLLEKDIIQFCGLSKGIVEYTAIMGNKISIPEIETDEDYVELINKDEVSQEENKPVATLGQIWVSAENFDADSEIDGLKFSLQPKDSKGEVVKAEGTVNIKLWKLECTERSEYADYCLQEECTRKDSLLIETWSIPVKLENYDYIGANIQAEYKSYKPQGDKYEQKGCIDVTFVTQDGKSFTTSEDAVYLAGF
jgi:hypothetical protein